MCASIPEKERAPVIVKIPVESVCNTSVPEPVALLATSNAALPVETSVSPAGFTLMEPVLMASALVLLAWVTEETFEPTPPWILFVPLVPAPITPPSTEALLNKTLPELFRGCVVNATSERFTEFPLELETVMSPVPLTPPLRVTTDPMLLPVAIVNPLVKLTEPLRVSAKSVATITFLPSPPTLTGFASVMFPPPEAGEMPYRPAATNDASAEPVPNKIWLFPNCFVRVPATFETTNAPCRISKGAFNEVLDALITNGE